MMMVYHYVHIILTLFILTSRGCSGGGGSPLSYETHRSLTKTKNHRTLVVDALKRVEQVQRHREMQNFCYDFIFPLAEVVDVECDCIERQNEFFVQCNSCEYCVPHTSPLLCEREVFNITYDKNSDDIIVLSCFEATSPFQEEVCVRSLENTATQTVFSCTATLNGASCLSCDPANCNAFHGQEFNIDCSNVPNGTALVCENFQELGMTLTGVDDFNGSCKSATTIIATPTLLNSMIGFFIIIIFFSMIV